MTLADELLIVDSLPAWWSPDHHPNQTPPDPRVSAALYRERVQAFWTALASSPHAIQYVVASDGGTSYCGFATSVPDQATFLVDTINGIFPGTTFRIEPAARFRQDWLSPDCIQGIPVTSPDFPPQAMDRLVRAMARRPFAFVTELWPTGKEWIDSATGHLQEQLRILHYRRERDKHNPAHEVEERNLSRNLERYRQARDLGCWQAFMAILTATPEDQAVAKSAVESSFQNTPGGAATVRWVPYTGTKVWNALLATEVTELAHFPTESSPGYKLTPAIRLGAAAPIRTPDGPTISLGETLSGGGRTGHTLSLPLGSFYRHAAVIGATGAGKTTAICTPLLQSWALHETPFLIIEPGLKREFRNLLSESWAQPLQLFSVGEPNCALRLNLFEPQGVPLSTHIGYLKSLLLGAYAWITPQQYVLEQALYRVYEERGFDLTTGSNRRGHGRSLWPSLSDLINVLPSVVRQAGYDAQITRNLLAGLTTRLRTIARGPVGGVINCRHSTPMAALLSTPAIVELALVGSDEEKALLMGALLMFVAEHCLASGHQRSGHWLVIEEAHRLLRNTVTDQRDEVGNARGQAVEAFVNLLAELRAFREGVVVIEQSPMLLHPNVLANTSLKMCFRLGDADNAELMARTFHLDQGQRRALADLPTGTALVFDSDVGGPYHVRFPHFSLSPASPRQIAANTQELDRFYGAVLSTARVTPTPLERELALTWMLAVAAGDDPFDIVAFAVFEVQRLGESLTLPGLEAAIAEVITEKGITGGLRLEHEDVLCSRWREFLHGLIIERIPGIKLATIVQQLRRETDAWGMPPSRRYPSQCHANCRAWFEARMLAARNRAHIRVESFPQSNRCLRDAIRLAL